MKKAIVILSILLAACSGGEAVVSDQADTATNGAVGQAVQSVISATADTATKVPPAEGVRCGDADLTNAPAGWCSNPNDIIHTGKPNS